jgi:hypothetical protein
LANHYLFEPVACTPESGWEKGQVENQVGNISEWLFTPTPSFADFAELNAWLARRCQKLSSRLHPYQPSRTIADCFAEERPLLMPVCPPLRSKFEVLWQKYRLCISNRNGLHDPLGIVFLIWLYFP